MNTNIVLKHGSHNKFADGSCALEWVDYLDRSRRGVPVAPTDHLTDAPACVCPVLRNFVVSWNDSLRSDEERTRILGPVLPRLLDTRSTRDVERRRSAMALDWLIRTFTPAWLDLAKLASEAKALRGLPEIVDLSGLLAAQPLLDAAREKAAVAWDAAGAVAWDAARAVARDAAGAVARDAAWDAAWDGAWAAAWDALAPTVAELQVSALALLDRMIDVR